MNWSLSEKEAIVLALLRDGAELYGLQLVELSEAGLKRGTVYVTLGRMEEKGLVSSRQEPGPRASGGLPRRLYRITSLASELLELRERSLRVLRKCEANS